MQFPIRGWRLGMCGALVSSRAGLRHSRGACLPLMRVCMLAFSLVLIAVFVRTCSRALCTPHESSRVPVRVLVDTLIQALAYAYSRSLHFVPISLSCASTSSHHKGRCCAG